MHITLGFPKGCRGCALGGVIQPINFGVKHAVSLFLICSSSEALLVVVYTLYKNTDSSALFLRFMLCYTFLFPMSRIRASYITLPRERAHRDT